MDIEALLKCGKSYGSDDIYYVLAQAIYDLQQQIKALQKETAALDHRTTGSIMIGRAEY